MIEAGKGDDDALADALVAIGDSMYDSRKFPRKQFRVRYLKTDTRSGCL